VPHLQLSPGPGFRVQLQDVIEADASIRLLQAASSRWYDKIRCARYQHVQ
jgi:hypothetical protein